VARNAWQLYDEGSAGFVLDNDGRVQWVKVGALSLHEVQQEVDLLHKLLSK
ncbi:YtfJ family protein, partial [Salmonella enterica subsp. enterica serovar Braenderup]|uniref:YtfJ family protein n=1 Tax=Salmonella enterica TaxID=28901 RepID=UPI000BD5F505